VCGLPKVIRFAAEDCKLAGTLPVARVAGVGGV